MRRATNIFIYPNLLSLERAYGATKVWDHTREEHKDRQRTAD